MGGLAEPLIAHRCTERTRDELVIPYEYTEYTTDKVPFAHYKEQWGCVALKQLWGCVLQLQMAASAHPS